MAKYTLEEFTLIHSSDLPCKRCSHPYYKHDSGIVPDLHCGGMPPDYECNCKEFVWSKWKMQNNRLYDMGGEMEPPDEYVLARVKQNKQYASEHKH